MVRSLYPKSFHDFTEDDFERLKNAIQKSPSLYSLDSLNCALFYGLWWKYAYEEGKPSKEMIFNSLNRNYRTFNDEEFYQKAKEEGRKLGLKWIQKEYTLYFRTLLLQGGIPLKNLKKYGTAYRKFLLKVIEQRPVDISDIADSFEVTKDLPISTRNEFVFEAALNISKAIWDDTEEGRNIINLLEQNQQGDLVAALKKHKKEIEKIAKSQIKIKTFWELNQTTANEANIILKSDLPDKMGRDSFADMIGTDVDDLSNSYNLFCDEDLLATYRKSIKGDFLKYPSSFITRQWTPENQQLPLLYFADNSGKKHPIPAQIKAIPNRSIPTLWLQMEEKRWIMSPKNNHNGENAFVLTSEPDHCTGNPTELTIENKIFYLFEIKQSTTLQINEEESVSFQLCTTTFDWFIRAEQPGWIARANMIIVTSLPRIYFYDESGSKLLENQISKKWRRKGEIIWHEYNGALPVGIIELKFCHNNVTEYDRVFNIGDCSLKFMGGDILKPTICFNHNFLRLEIKANDLYNTSEELNRSLKISFLDSNRIPKHIRGHIRSNYGNLSFDMVLPAHGIDIVDKDDSVVPNNYVFLLNNIFGYRIVCGDNQGVKFHNEKYPDLVIRQTLQNGLIPLRNYNTIIKKLFQLTDGMAASNVVVMEMHGKKIQFKAYNAILSYTNEDGSLRQTEDGRMMFRFIKNAAIEFHIPQSDYLLYAVPLNCELSEIVQIELERCEDGFCFPMEVSGKEFIVFDTNTDTNCKILPTYVTSNQANIVFPHNYDVLYQNKLSRITTFSVHLEKDSIDGIEWQKLVRYIQLCTKFNLPFSAFDSIRAAASSSNLAAKLFFLMACNSENNEDFIRACEKMEEELGFRFHWCSFGSFDAAFNWTLSTCGEECITSLLEKSSLVIEPKFLMFQQHDWRMPDGFHLNTAINNMRARLGESVIDELPHRRPWMRKNRKAIIPLSTELDKLKIMARCPIATAIVKLNLYTAELPTESNAFDLWHLNNYEVRRNMIYCENLDPEWYDLAITYGISHINKH